MSTSMGEPLSTAGADEHVDGGTLEHGGAERPARGLEDEPPAGEDLDAESTSRAPQRRAPGVLAAGHGWTGPAAGGRRW
jgi:hypothetical protein